MNNKRRELLRNAVTYIDKAYTMISEASDQEQDCMDDMPENLQSSEQYENMGNAVDYLDNALLSLYDASENVDRAISS